MKLHFWGATEGVTGSKTVLELPGGKILIDCGLIQGEAEAVKKNWEALPFAPSEIHALILTHAHLDHCGYIPKFVKDGFRGTIFCSKATKELSLLIMADSAKLQESNEAKRPLYTSEDVNRVRSLMKVKELGQVFSVVGARISFQNAGHILGAVSVVIDSGKKIVFSGDLGRHDDPLMLAPEHCPPADFVVMESTYGGRNRQGNIAEELKNLLVKAHQKNQSIIIASFAVARAQMLLTLIYEFYQNNPGYRLDVFTDSPMMNEANKIYKRHSDETKHPDDLYEAIEQAHIVQHIKEWEYLKMRSKPFIVIASSGMVTGGRIWRYLKYWQDDSSMILFLPGYQGEGTPGRILSEGGRMISDGDDTVINWAGEVLHSDAFSSHADQKELAQWVTHLNKTSQVFLIHGDPGSKQKMKDYLVKNGAGPVVIPKPNEVFDLIGKGNTK